MGGEKAPGFFHDGGGMLMMQLLEVRLWLNGIVSIKRHLNQQTNTKSERNAKEFGSNTIFAKRKGSFSINYIPVYGERPEKELTSLYEKKSSLLRHNHQDLSILMNLHHNK